MNSKKSLGLIVNPIAGIGGRVGLKGSDSKEIQEKALSLGAELEAPDRAFQTIKTIANSGSEFDILTCSDKMGEYSIRKAGLNPIIIGETESQVTSSADTINAAIKMMKQQVDLLLFAGGDGTARDIYQAIGSSLPVLGIPAGVKIHSAVFATNPVRAGEVVLDFLDDKITEFKESEVMDIDEKAFRSGRLSAKLYGYLKVPYKKLFVQDLKSGSSVSDTKAFKAISEYIVDNMESDIIYLIGPGTTTRRIMNILDLDNSLLGIDAVENRKLIGYDLNEREILEIIEGKEAKIICSVIGGQGYLFGRGNQQLSAKVISRIGKDNIIILASENKIADLNGRPLLVDTGDLTINNELSGYYKIIVGYNNSIIYPVKY